MGQSPAPSSFSPACFSTGDQHGCCAQGRLPGREGCWLSWPPLWAVGRGHRDRRRRSGGQRRLSPCDSLTMALVWLFPTLSVYYCIYL